MFRIDGNDTEILTIWFTKQEVGFKRQQVYSIKVTGCLGVVFSITVPASPNSNDLDLVNQHLYGYFNALLWTN